MVRIACLCPPTPVGEVRHPDGDDVKLKDPLDFRSAATMQKAVTVLKADRPDSAAEEVLAVLTEAYLRYGIESWTLVDDKGRAVPVNPDTVTAHVLANMEAAMLIGEEADGLYSPVVLLPLLSRVSNSSPPTQATGSTSRATGSSQKPRKPSKPSSTTTSRTDDIDMTSASPVGAYSSSRSSA